MVDDELLQMNGFQTSISSYMVELRLLLNPVDLWIFHIFVETKETSQAQQCLMLGGWGESFPIRAALSILFDVFQINFYCHFRVRLKVVEKEHQWGKDPDSLDYFSEAETLSADDSILINRGLRRWFRQTGTVWVIFCWCFGYL